jgi:hypothetical protein
VGSWVDVGRDRAGQLQRLVMRFGRQCDDQVEIEPFPILQFLERDRLVAGNVLAQFGHHRDRERIEFALPDPGGFDI